MKNVVQKIRYLISIRSAAEVVRKGFFKTDFDLEKFGDTEELMESFFTNIS